MPNFHVASSREHEIGIKCRDYALANQPNGWIYVHDSNKADVFISVMYDTLITEEYLKGRRCYNFHPGILPNYRGSGAYSWCLINKEKTTGVTLHEIDPDIDHGGIIHIERTGVLSSDTAETLFNRCMYIMLLMFVSWFDKLIANRYSLYHNEGGHLYLRKHLQEVKDISHLVKAFTFAGKGSAYWIDSKGSKHYVEYE